MVRIYKKYVGRVSTQTDSRRSLHRGGNHGMGYSILLWSSVWEHWQLPASPGHTCWATTLDRRDRLQRGRGGRGTGDGRYFAQVFQVLGDWVHTPQTHKYQSCTSPVPVLMISSRPHQQRQQMPFVPWPTGIPRQSAGPVAARGRKARDTSFL